MIKPVKQRCKTCQYFTKYTAGQDGRCQWGEHHLGKVPECLAGLLVTVRSRGGKDCAGYIRSEQYSD